MFIIGTSGHVDHGKTLLIKTLTGIDTDRLPEEKKRGLTIDLGFAHFTGSDDKQIGVVDVPGHEKFIRNMTAGAWGIDLALLVIAADDGWMPQTENHLKVLTAMGISDIIITVTKSDLAGAARISEVREFAEESVLEMTGKRPESISVSARTGLGIDELKTLIIKHLEAHEPSSSQFSEPLMFIDRVFSIKGAGLVATGSLREGPISRGDSLLLLPAGKEVKIRGLQTHDMTAETAAPSVRAALNITGVTTEEIGRGSCITTFKSGFTAEEEAVIMLTSGMKNIRNHGEAEFASGTAHSIGTIHFINDSSCARIILEKKTALRTGLPMVIIRKGGSRITGSGIVIWKGPSGHDERRRIASAADSIKLPYSKEEDIRIKLAVHGWADDSGIFSFSAAYLQSSAEMISKLITSRGGMKSREIAGVLNLPSGPADALCGKLEKAGKLKLSGESWFTSDGTEPELSPQAQMVFDAADKAGLLGLDLLKEKIPGVHKELRSLTRAGLIVPISENLFYTDKVFTEVCALVLAGLKPGDTFDIAHTKEKTGLSRKYIIPLLNKMEERGIVEREDNMRRVKKLISAGPE
ncbi:MAG: selenocysteine-specific translation elongation factor [Spirochaetales bacterium]|nr:selenocysteine-specific translation elongation factor [Spirochaetales bacterium]